MLFLYCRRDGLAKFTCAQIECPPGPPGCVPQHSLGDCCASNNVCDEKEVAKLSKCNYLGNEYTQGQKFWPDSAPCHYCLCDTGFDNSTRVEDNKHCRKVDCGIEFRNLDRIRKGCVPVYFGDNACCPIEFRCRKYIVVIIQLEHFVKSIHSPAAEDTDEVMPSEGRTELVETDPKLMCTFAKLNLQRYEQLNSSDKCVQCTCKNPPMVECRRDPKC